MILNAEVVARHQKDKTKSKNNKYKHGTITNFGVKVQEKWFQAQNSRHC